MKTTFSFAAAFLLAAFAASPANAAAPEFQFTRLAIGLSPLRSVFTWFSVDSPGQGKLAGNPALVETNWHPQLTPVIRYIQNQAKRHGRKTFREEYVEFLNRFEIPHDERYIFEPVEAE